MKHHLFLYVFLLAGSPAFAAPDERLIAVSRDGVESAVSALLAAHADVDLQDDTGATALSWAVLRNNGAVVARLLAAPANPKLADAKRLLITRHENALRAITKSDAPPDVTTLLKHHLTEPRQDLSTLEQAAAALNPKRS